MVGYPRIELGMAEPADLQSAASPLMLLPQIVAPQEGLEPPTSKLTVWRYYQLSY